MERKTIETATARIWWDEGGFIRGVISAGADERLEHAQANVRAALSLAAGRKVPVIIDLREMKSVSKEARDWYAGDEPAKYALAQALLIGSPISKLIGNFFIGLNRTRFPTRLFTSETEAVAWLKGFLQ